MNSLDPRPLRIAMLGLRGVPATFGGVERHVEEVGARLVARGHDVTVFCRTNYVRSGAGEHRGMKLVHLPTIGTKHLDAIAHTALATAQVLRGFDVVHYHAVGPGLLAPVPRVLSTAKVVQTVHGLDAERAKWGRAARAVLRSAEWLSARVPDATIAVSSTVADHYRTVHGRETCCIENGMTPLPHRPAEEITTRFGLEAESYVLFVGRLVPEKAPDVLIRAFRRLADPEMRLAIVGGSSFTDPYVEKLHSLAAGDDRIIFTGYQYGPVLEELFGNAAAFVSASALEAGPPLVLLEAASCGLPWIVSDIPDHREAVPEDQPGGRLFTPGDDASLADALERVLADVESERRGAKELAATLLETRSWDRTAAATESVYRHVVAGRPVTAAR